MNIIVYIGIGVILAIGYGFINIYNDFKKYKNAAEATIGQIKVAMKKRLDMIEQLLGAVKGYVRHEREIFENIAKLRLGIETADSGKLGEIEQESRTITGSLLAVAEAYPDLKASESVQKLMEAVIDVEDEIARHRYTFNNIVQQYNTMQDTIPSSLLAGFAGASKIGYLEFEEKIQNPPDISVN
ncbi:LemA family protein [Thermoproteota archaeon]